MARFALTFLAALAIAGAVGADTAYIQPSTYSPDVGQTITIEAAFNDVCCEPKYAVRSQSYTVILPNGFSVAPDRIETFATATVIEQTIMREGTTRITTGERLGRAGGEYVLLDGVYHLINGDDGPLIEVPEGTPVLTSQTATVSDTYVTVGQPDWNSVEYSIGRLQIIPAQHPSALAKGDVFRVQILMDGVPVSGQAVLVTRALQRGGGHEEGEAFETDREGEVSIPLTYAGTHVLMTRLQAPAPADADTDIRSYTTALTVNVAP